MKIKFDFKDMNTSNKLTVLRIVLIIPFLMFLWLSYFGQSDEALVMALKGFLRIMAMGIFCLAVVTDYYDGKIARETDTVTDFGKLMDPIADKLLTFTFLLVLLQANVISLLLVLILLFREFYITSLRAYVSNKTSEIIPASKYGKYKTVALYAGLFVIGLMPVFSYATFILNSLLLLPAVVLSILSAVDYTKKALKILGVLEDENDEEYDDDDESEEIVEELDETIDEVEGE